MKGVRSRGALVGASVALACAAGCELAFPNTIREDTDAAAPDASAPADGASSAGCDGGADPVDARAPNLLDNGDFEVAGASGACGAPWFAWAPSGSASLADSPVAHTGAHACRVCNHGASNFSIDEPPFTSAPAGGGTFVARAWVRSAPDAGARPVVLRARAANGPAAQTPVGAQPTDCWQPISVTLSVPAGVSGRIDVYAFEDGAGPDDCFLIDDVLVYAQ